jgi:flagellar basal body-associated protein FliL
MAKRKRVKRSTRRAVHKSTNQNRLSILLIILALLVFALAAIAMSQGSGSSNTSNQAKVTASPTAKPAVKTAK